MQYWYWAVCPHCKVQRDRTGDRWIANCINGFAIDVGIVGYNFSMLAIIHTKADAQHPRDAEYVQLLLSIVSIE
jgi:hypothetical protein